MFQFAFFSNFDVDHFFKNFDVDHFFFFRLHWVFFEVRGLLIVVASLVAEHGL